MNLVIICVLIALAVIGTVINCRNKTILFGKSTLVNHLVMDKEHMSVEIILFITFVYVFNKAYIYVKAVLLNKVNIVMGFVILAILLFVMATMFNMLYLCYCKQKQQDKM